MSIGSDTSQLCVFRVHDTPEPKKAANLAKLAKAPFLKVEATKFTEVGYVGRDVDQIIRDLVDVAIVLVREKMRKEVYSKAVLKQNFVLFKQ